MKKILTLLIIFTLSTASLIEVKEVVAAEVKTVSISIPANTGLIGDDNAVKSYNLDLPSGVTVASINTGSFKYSGSNQLNGNITLENGMINLKLNGVSNNKTISNVLGYRASFGSLFISNPYNSIWRYSDGRRWQINEYDESNDGMKTKDMPAEDNANPSDRPPRVVISAAPYQSMDYLKWYDGSQANVIDSKYINASTIKPYFESKYSSNTIKEIKFKNNRVIVNYAIPYFVNSDGKITEQTYVNQDADSSHPLVGHAQGRKYEVTATYYYKADAKVPTYSYSGSVSFSYTPITEPTLDGGVSILKPSPNPAKFEGKDTEVSLRVKGDLLAYNNSSNIEEWIFYAKETGSSDVKTKKDYGKVLNSTQTFDNFVIPKSRGSNVKQEYTLTVTVRFTKPVVTGSGTVSSLSKTMKATVEVSDSPIPTTPPPTNNNKPPKAILDVSEEVMAGEETLIYGKGSYDPDGTIVDYKYNTPGAVEPVSGPFGWTWYPLSSLGQHSVRLTVTDNGGLTGSTSAKINVIQPIPKAVIDVKGTKKENRKVTLLSKSRSPEHYPIDETKTQWTISPVSGGTAADIKYLGNLSGMNSKDVLFKKPGTFKATLTVTNTAGFGDSTSMTFDIIPDEPPVVYFSAPGKIYRDPANGNQAVAALTDMSFSPDYDFLAHRKWEYRYDAENDGDFSNNPWVPFNDANVSTLNLILYEVGRYEVRLTVTEEFDQPTIEEFITPADRKSRDSYSSAPPQPIAERVIEVYNRAPAVDWSW
ncbi:hypothetical protein [Paenibacillus rhizoplanae]|uniref:PKD/Chitinase domain-containing protein n=1 Tax=Paenibacillus rhizoplanae TaxID=1917181 RepID=A0ABW5F913_9BACL